MVAIAVELTDQQADALAAWCKLMCPEDIDGLVAEDDETREIVGGISALSRALAIAGYAPR